jgi:type IV pilus assembly protein PilO
MAINMADLSKVPAKQKVVLALLFCVMIGAGYYYVFYSEAAAKIASQEAKLAELNSKIKEQEVIARNLRSFQAEVKRLEEQLSVLLEQLPNSAEIPNLLRSVSDLGKESTLDFKKFAPKDEAKKEFYAEIPVSIVVTGDYHSFAQFADKVSRLSRIVNLSNIDFANPKLGPDGVITTNVSCTATTYRFLEQPPAAPKDAAGAAKTGADKGKAK